MANHVYRVFSSEDLFSTTIQAEPSISVWSGSSGYSGTTNYASASLSLYSGVRSRLDSGLHGWSGVQVYPLAEQVRGYYDHVDKKLLMPLDSASIAFWPLDDVDPFAAEDLTNNLSMLHVVHGNPQVVEGFKIDTFARRFDTVYDGQHTWPIENNDSTLLSQLSSGDLTIECWVKFTSPASLPSGYKDYNVVTLKCQDSSAPTNNLIMFGRSAAGNLRVLFGPSNISGSTGTEIVDVAVCSNDVPMLIGVRRKMLSFPSASFEFFINGVSTNAPVVMSSSIGLPILPIYATIGEYFLGTLQSVRVSNVARSDAEMFDSYTRNVIAITRLELQQQTSAVSMSYPFLGSIRRFRCDNLPQSSIDGIIATNEQWYEEHHSAVRNISQWYHDHVKTTYQPASAYPNVFTGWHVPEMFYDRQIATGSVLFTVNSFINSFSYPSTGTLYWRDDGLGRLWSVASPTSSWRDGTRVSATVMYNEGIVAFTHPDPLWHAQFIAGSNVNPFCAFEFRSVSLVKSMVFMCRMGPGEVNASNNPTYFVTDETGKRWAHDWATSNEATTYITSIGLYNEERQLVGVAKMAQPIRKRERDAVDIRLRLDL